MLSWQPTVIGFTSSTHLCCCHEQMAKLISLTDINKEMTAGKEKHRKNDSKSFDLWVASERMVVRLFWCLFHISFRPLARGSVCFIRTETRGTVTAVNADNSHMHALLRFAVSNQHELIKSLNKASHPAIALLLSSSSRPLLSFLLFYSLTACTRAQVSNTYLPLFDSLKKKKLTYNNIFLFVIWRPH